TATGPGAGTRAWAPSSCRSEAARGELLPGAARAAPAQRAGAARRGPAGVRGGRLHPPRRRPGAGARLRGDLEEPGLTHLRRARPRRDFLGRPLDAGSDRYLWLDALTQKVREGG